MEEDDPVRFGAEFGPMRTKSSSGVSLSTIDRPPFPGFPGQVQGQVL